MKFALALTTLAAMSAAGQGTMTFNTYNPIWGIDAKVVYSEPGAGATPVGAEFVGQLYGGVPGGPLLALGNPVPFRSDAGIGYITAGGKVPVAGVAGGSPAAVQLRAWRASLGATYEAVTARTGGLEAGASPVITLVLGGGPWGNVPVPTFDADLVGLQGFAISAATPTALATWSAQIAAEAAGTSAPEPTAAVLGLCGALCFIAVRPASSGGRQNPDSAPSRSR